MIDRYLLRILLTVTIFCVGIISLSAQEWSEREISEYFENKRIEDGFLLKGGGSTIPSLGTEYCSGNGFVDLVPALWDPQAASITWTITTFVGDEENHPDWGEYVGSGQNTVFRFYPDRVTEDYFGVRIYFSYIQKSDIGLPVGTANNDFTFVYKTPTAFQFGSDAEICQGESVILTLEASESGMEYQLIRDDSTPVGFPITGAGSPINFTVSVAGTYTVTAINLSKTDCETTMTGSATVVVNPLPVPVATSDKPSYCEGEPIELYGGPDAMISYTWEYPDGTIVTERNPVIASSVRTNHNGSYTLTVEDANGCVGTTTLNIVINERPQISPIADLEVCEDDPITVSPTVTGGTGPYTYLWEKGAITVATSATLSIPVATLADAGTYTLTVTDNNGCGSSSESFDVIVNPRPVIDNISNSGPVCVGAMVQLTVEVSGGSGIYSFAWNGPDGFSSTEQNPEIGPVTSASAGVYTVTVTDGEGCERTAQTTVVVNDLPLATLTGSASYCEGESETYIAGGGDFYTFFLNGTEVQARSISNTYNTLSSLAAGSYTLMVEVEDANGCTDQETYAFIIYPEPEATIAFDATAVCEGGSANLQITLTTGTTPWSLVYNNGTVDVAESNIPGATYTLAVTPTSDLTYTLVSVEDANGCSANIGSSATLLVNELPIVTVESSNDPSNQVCVGADLTLTATASGGSGSYVYQWYKAGAEIVGATASTYTIVGAQLSDADEYSVVVRDTDNGITCESAPASLTVDVTFATATLIGSTNVCEGTSETYVAGGGLSYSFILYEATSAIIETGPASADNTYSIPNNLAKGHYTLQVFVEDANGCTDDELRTFTVMEAPSNSITYSSTDICDGENITVTATSGYSSYDFTVNGASVQSGTNNVYSSNEWTSGDIVKVAITLGSCAVESAETTITVRDIPTVTLLSDQTDNMACLGEEVVFTAGGADNYTFSVNGTAVQGPGVANTYSSSTLADGDIVVVLGEDAFGCSAQASITLGVNTPTATISPNDTEICANETLILTANTGVLYEFFRNGTSLGETAVNPLEITDPADGDVFSVRVVNAHGCEETSPDITIIVHPVPIVNLTSSATEICVGDPITFNAEGGNQYSFYVIRGGVDILLQSGASDSFVTTELQDGDEVYVVVRDANMCNAISPNIDITVNPLPTAGINVLPSNIIGEGDDVTVEASGGNDYLYLVNGLPHDGNPNGWTTEASLVISGLVNGDVLSIKARSTFGCEDTSEPVIIETTPYPLPFDLLPLESQYCSDEAGVRLYLSSYEDENVTYQLYKIGTPDEEVMITPSPVEGIYGWDNVPEGTYRVKATRIPIGLERWSEIVIVTQNEVPQSFNMTPTGIQTSCPIEISLDNSEDGINYYLMLNGSVFAGPLTGNGIPLNFGSYNVAGSYTVYAVNPVTGCSADMNGVLDFDIDPMPVAFALSSLPTDGHYCEGEEGVRLILDLSTTGVEYWVYRGASAVGGPYIGGGEEMIFGPFTEEGTYRVMAAGGGGGCLVPMDGVVEIRMNSAPYNFDVVAGNDGYFCPNTDGVEISLSGQQEGVHYQLWFNGEEKGPSFIGNSNPELSFGLQNEAGVYIVRGTMPGTACSGDIGSVELFADDLPEQFELGGDDSYCVGGAAVLQLSGSQSGVKYALYFEGGFTGVEEVGDGGLVSFTVGAAGEYYVMATIDNEHTSCEVQMGDPVTVIEKALPETNGITFNIVDGTDCDNGSVITVNNPQAGVRYELYRLDANSNPSATNNYFIADGLSSSVDFAQVVDNSATYVVHASLDGCELPFFSNEFEVNIAGAIARFSVSGNADLCEGDGFGVLSLDGSESGVSYTLINTSSGQVYPPKTGDGSSLEWNDISDEGLYIIEASNGVDACTQTMLGEFDLQFHRLPESYIVSASHPVFCTDEPVEISINQSEPGVNYTLYRSATEGGAKAVVGSTTGASDGGLITFIDINNMGYYSVIATSPEGCTSSMNAILHIEEKPVIDVSAVTISDNDFCSADAATIVLENTKADVLYSLYDGATLIASASPVADGESVEFEDIVSGTYRVLASYDGACEVVINETYEVVATWTSPVQPVVISEAAYCQNEAIAEIETSEIGVSYFLVEDDAFDLAAVLPGTVKIDGTGEAILWDLSSLALGHQFFTVVAQSNDGCVTLSEMYGFNLSECAPPIGEYYIDIPEDGLAYCSDEDGVVITVNSTTEGAYYELVEVGNEEVPLQVLKGNGGSVSFINPVKGTMEYTIIVQGSDELFTGGAFWVTENPTPNAYMLSSGGSVGVHEITLSGSDIATSYYLTVDLTDYLDSPVMIGDGEELNFGTVDVAGDYHVMAVSAAGCIRLMDGVSAIYQSQLVAVADTLYLGPGELVGIIDLGLNDSEYYIPDLDVPGEIGNIRFSHIPDANTMLDIDINGVTGMLTYRKSPSFYGKDSLSYLIENIDVPGRMATAKVIIMVGNKDFDEERSFLLPNAFSPNGDDINEKFIISGLGETEESSLEVFNRWGTIVYRSEGKRYDNSWDGTSNMGTMVSIGKELPSGVYFYVFEVVKNIEGKIQKRRYNGFVELRR